MSKLNKKEAKKLEMKNRLEVLELVYDLQFHDDPKLAKRLKQKLREEFKKRVFQ